MKNIRLFMLAMSLVISPIMAAETIHIQSPYSPSHSGTPAMLKIIDQANSSQDRYRFLLEYRPGGEQLIAINHLEKAPHNRLAIIAPKFVEHVESGKVNEQDFLPVHALGDACWAVISNLGSTPMGIKNLQGINELVVGGVGIGNATHITSLQLAEKYGFKVRYVPFRSNFDALVLMVSDGSINMVLDRVINYHQYQEKSPALKMLAMSCPTRHPSAPDLPTLKEQGIEAPYVFNITVAHKLMDEKKRQEITEILADSTKTLGVNEIRKLSDMIPPYFTNTDLEKYHHDSISMMRKMIKKHQDKIREN